MSQGTTDSTCLPVHYLLEVPSVPSPSLSLIVPSSIILTLPHRDLRPRAPHPIDKSYCMAVHVEVHYIPVHHQPLQTEPGCLNFLQVDRPW